MKSKSKELTVDTIGQQINPLTKEEEKMISNFILSKKEKSRHKKSAKRVTAVRKEKLLG